MQSVVINMDGAPRMVSTDKETVGELLEDLADTIDTEFYLEDAKEKILDNRNEDGTRTR